MGAARRTAGHAGSRQTARSPSLTHPAGAPVWDWPTGLLYQDDLLFQSTTQTMTKPLLTINRRQGAGIDWACEDRLPSSAHRRGGCNGYKPAARGWGRGQAPRHQRVSWDDAKSYTTWLSRKTNKKYRLLSAAEHECATRAGMTTPFWRGSSITPEQANYNGVPRVCHLARRGGLQAVCMGGRAQRCPRRTVIEARSI
jgi:hypothetical protein